MVDVQLATLEDDHGRPVIIGDLAADVEKHVVAADVEREGPDAPLRGGQAEVEEVRPGVGPDLLGMRVVGGVGDEEFHRLESGWGLWGDSASILERSQNISYIASGCRGLPSSIAAGAPPWQWEWMRSILPLLALATLPLGGCAASLAAGAIGAAVQAADRPDPPLKEDPGPAARAACTGRASQYGNVRIIDTVYRSPAKLVVWGSVESEGRRRSFRCRFDGRIVGFELREVEGRR